MSKQVQGYVTYAITANAMKAAAGELRADKGLPESQWTAAHKEALALLQTHYGDEPKPAGKNALVWGCGWTFEPGCAAQKALSRVCGFITGETQRKMRVAAKASKALKAMDKRDRSVARIEAVFAHLEKIAKKESLSSAEKAALARHAKHLLLLCK